MSGCVQHVADYNLSLSQFAVALSDYEHFYPTQNGMLVHPLPSIKFTSTDAPGWREATLVHNVIQNTLNVTEETQMGKVFFTD